MASLLAKFASAEKVSIASALQICRNYLDALDCKLLLEEVLQQDRAFLLANQQEILSEAQLARFLSLVKRRLAGEPLAYIVGNCGFYGRQFIVSDQVLIPRADSEVLIEVVLAKFSANDTFTALDLGSGSGCLGLTIALERNNCQMLLSDISPGALEICQANARLHQLSVSVNFCLSDWFAAISGEFDLIVANPPYLASNDRHLVENGLNYEPILALCGRGLVLDAAQSIKFIVDHASGYLRQDAWLVIEHAFDQAEVCRQYFHSAGYTEVSTVKDLPGNDRVTYAQWRN